jgi:hypothetical protein
VLQKARSHPPDGALDRSKRFLDLLVGPVGTILTRIDFQQDLGVQDLARWRVPCFDQVV